MRPDLDRVRGEMAARARIRREKRLSAAAAEMQAAAEGDRGYPDTDADHLLEEARVLDSLTREGYAETPLNMEEYYAGVGALHARIGNPHPALARLEELLTLDNLEDTLTFLRLELEESRSAWSVAVSVDAEAERVYEWHMEQAGTAHHLLTLFAVFLLGEVRSGYGEPWRVTGGVLYTDQGVNVAASHHAPHRVASAVNLAAGLDPAQLQRFAQARERIRAAWAGREAVPLP